VNDETVIVFTIPKSELKKNETEMLKKLYKSQDVALMIRHERKITEWFFKISLFGEVLEVVTDTPEANPKQLSIL